MDVYLNGEEKMKAAGGLIEMDTDRGDVVTVRKTPL